ncbi:MAG: DNA-3-methyladenine glycosylase, partial [Candidatus Peribacteraceae bacterium]|nr:DNA-3-methyladenine glycosylase [Candidatus Peribacteraceae bacterium]
MKRRVLPTSFFRRPVLAVAPELLGKFLVRRMRGKIIAAMITEVEAYDGPEDKACHAHRGKTHRNAVMFGPAGRWYVYFVYGMHWMLNIVTGERGYPAAVLVRGVRECNGPAKLTKAFRIDGRLNGAPASK